MARIIVQAVHGDGEPRRWTLSERIVAENLADDHYSAHLLERLRWATHDAEALESQTADRAADGDGLGTPVTRPVPTPQPAGPRVRLAPGKVNA